LTELAMARELRWWLAAALLACGAVALAYLPPRGAGGKSRLRDEPFRQTPARQRAQALAAQWRAASLALRLPEYRKRPQPELLRLLRRVRNTGQRRAALAGPAGLRPGPRPPVGPRAARATSVLLRDVRGRGTLVVAERVPVSGHRHRLHGRPHIELPGRCALRCR